MAENGNAPPQPCPACGSLVEVGDAEPLTRVVCPHCGEKFRVQSVFDHFEIVETLGVGGMGSVYKARDRRLERFVALKLLRKELSADPAEAARLEQEARLTAAVNHPNVIQVYSSGTANGQIYLVMELVDHGSLDDLMAQHTRLPERQVLEAGIQVAKGLQAAQERGLIHRDVKPANILFANPDTAKIGDFGLAVAAEHNAEARREIWGTPYYVAPERLDNAPEDFRSDIYSLGATLFHAIAGKPPMEGETTSASELRKLKANPPGLREVMSDVSRETARVIDRTLLADPAARFVSYAELIAELERARASLEQKPAGLPARLLASVFVALLALGGGAVYFWHQQSVTPTVAGAPSPAPSATPDNTAALQKRFIDAREQLVRGNYDTAASAFTKIAAEADKRQPLANWARLQFGLALMLQGKLSAARDTFRQIESAGASAAANDNDPLRNFLSETAKSLAAPGPIRGAEGLQTGGPNGFALFLFGIKDWQLREFDEGAGLLRKFLEVEPPNEFKWISELKPIARKYNDDHALYTESKTLPSRLTNAAEARSALEKVRALEKRAQSRGAFVDYLKEQEKSLSASATKLEKTEREAREHAQEEDFQRRKPLMLAQWKEKLIKDLATGAYKVPITMGSTTYQGISGANDREIKLRIAPYGEAPFTWDKFPPEVLLQLSRAFIRPDAGDAAERRWLAAVYAQSTEQTDAAHELADGAAKTKPEYKEQARFLFPAEH